MPPLHKRVKGGTGMLVGPVKVELVGVFQFTWNCHRLRELAPKESLR